MSSGGSDTPTISTDLRSDISFMNRQKELRTLYRDFRNVLQTITSLSPKSTPVSRNIDEDEEDDLDSSSDELENDVQLILNEIELMQSETDEIIQLLSKQKFAKNARVKTIKKQLTHLQRVNSNLKARAEALLDLE